MNRQKKRRLRLIVALGAAIVLSSALVYSSFSASTEARSPSQLRDVGTGESYELTGRSSPAIAASATSSTSAYATARGTPPCGSATRARSPTPSGPAAR